MSRSEARAVRIPDGAEGFVTGKLHEPAAGGPGQGAPLLAVTHGAGGNLDTPGLARLAEGLAGRGVRVLRFNLPAAEAGKKRPDRPERAVRAIGAAAEWAEREAGQGGDDGPVFLGGRSFGGRMASVFLAGSGRRFAGGLLLAYPLRPPGKAFVPPERAAHLAGIEVPLLFVSGDRDPFAPPALFEPAVSGAAGGRASLRWIVGADHGFRVPKARLAETGRTAASVDGEIADAAAEFLLGAAASADG